MAAWFDKAEGDIQVDCPICLTKVSKKRRGAHFVKCWDIWKESMSDLLIKCPLYADHIIPRKFLNHHLDGNCEAASNQLRKYFQNPNLKSELRPMPADFMCDVPDDLLNSRNKQLLYYLRRDLDGNDISTDKVLYPDDA